METAISSSGQIPENQSADGMMDSSFDSSMDSGFDSGVDSDFQGEFDSSMSIDEEVEP